MQSGVAWLLDLTMEQIHSPLYDIHDGTIVYWMVMQGLGFRVLGYIGIMEKKMDTTIVY